jgi:hypothetical protein
MRLTLRLRITVVVVPTTTTTIMTMKRRRERRRERRRRMPVHRLRHHRRQHGEFGLRVESVGEDAPSAPAG